jgi:hypothetical protein
MVRGLARRLPAAAVLAAAGVLAAYDVYLLGWRLAEVQGNLEAQMVIITPAFVVSHLLRARQSRVQHREVMEQHRKAMAAQEDHAEQLAAHRDETAVLAEKVGELHDFHLHMKLPDREVGPAPSSKHRSNP